MGTAATATKVPATATQAVPPRSQLQFEESTLYSSSSSSGSETSSDTSSDESDDFESGSDEDANGHDAVSSAPELDDIPICGSDGGQQRRNSEPAVRVPPLVVVSSTAGRRASVQVGVAGKTPKEERSISLARTPTKHVRNMSRYKRRSRRAQREKALHGKSKRCQVLLAAATYRRGHARHVVDLPAHIVKQYRDTITECQLELAELSGVGATTASGGKAAAAVPVWFVGDRCTTKVLPGEAGEAVSLRRGKVAYVGRLPRRLGGGVWIGVELEVQLPGIGHDGRLGSPKGKRLFECEMGHGHFFRPTDLIVTAKEEPTGEKQGKAEEKRD